ncbi:MAG TPA: GNAT family N-acetyltransferase [Novosphingobium sp.]|nr:GNAT family N-acetyltransferase [Novosphingobium sp.]
MVTVDYHDDLKNVQGDPALAALLSAPAAPAPFDRLAWWQGLADHCGLRPLLAVAREGDALAVLALRREAGRLEALANWYTFRFRPILTANAGAGLLDALARDLARRTPRLVLSGLPDEDPASVRLAEALSRTGWTVWTEPCDTNHVLALDGRSFADYLAARPGPLRTTLKRKRGKVQALVIDRFDGEAWAAFEAIYAASWKPAEGSPAFLRAFAEAEGSAGRLRFGMAFADGEPVAAQFWTVEGATAFIHKLAHRQDSTSLSPGTVLSAALFEQVIDRDRVAMVDFGTGDDAYKRDWMEQVRTRHRLTALRPGAPANWPLLARRAIARLA